MEKLKSYFNEHKFIKALLLILAVIIIVLLILFVLIGVPLLINSLYKSKATHEIFKTLWHAEDTLNYYGTALSFFGTALLSALALWQNHVIKTESDKHTNLLERMENQKNMPILYFGASSMGGKCGQLGLYIENISDNIATEIQLSEIRILNDDGTEFWSNRKEQRIAHLKDRRDLSLKNPCLTSINQIFSFQLSYQDKFGELHQCNVEGRQMSKDISFPRFFVKEIGRKP